MSTCSPKRLDEHRLRVRPVQVAQAYGKLRIGYLGYVDRRIYSQYSMFV